jgi:hemerythrin
MPIPGESVTLNHAELLSQAKDEQQQLRDKLMEMLETVTYKEIAKSDAEMTEAVETTFKSSPLPIFVG